MRSAVADILPPRLKRSLARFGRDLAVARRKRRLTLDMMAERVGVAKATYQRLEKGDPTVAFGAYVMALWVLGFGDAFSEIAESSRDLQGLSLDEERLPKRVRTRKQPQST
jgi:transcriptional regulator with XRE-family HTH domain